MERKAYFHNSFYKGIQSLSFCLLQRCRKSKQCYRTSRKRQEKLFESNHGEHKKRKFLSSNCVENKGKEMRALESTSRCKATIEVLTEYRVSMPPYFHLHFNGYMLM